MSKNIHDKTKDGIVYSSLTQLVRDNVATSTSIHNQIAHSQVSRRHRLRITDNDQQNRRSKMKKKLLEKLKKRKQKK